MYEKFIYFEKKYFLIDISGNLSLLLFLEDKNNPNAYQFGYHKNDDIR